MASCSRLSTVDLGSAGPIGWSVTVARLRHFWTVVGLMSIMLLGATAALMALEDHPLDRVLFEVASAISTTGLSTGITPQLSDASCLILALLMFVGRVGPISLGTALALRPRPLLYEPPKERPLIG